MSVVYFYGPPSKGHLEVRAIYSKTTVHLVVFPASETARTFVLLLRRAVI